MTPTSKPKPPSKPRRRPKADATPREDRVADDAAVTALLDVLTDGVATLPEALERGEEARRARAESARELLGSRELRAAARRVPELGRSIETARAELDRQDTAAEQARSELHDASKEWLTALKALRNPGA
ncbi:hypothetical protein ACEYYH_13835 [Microbacterium trichothecenolyticum]|uniref:hypothetical protein n=1 Tax=Microbacterium trichothecenolyticum TaxID=69370 RepID=UPI0035BE8771